MLCALIMAGGKGTRFWPLSTEEKPKQFLNLLGKETMIQMTVNRLRKYIPIENIFIATGEKYVALVREQISDIPKNNIIVEPVGRNTAPCIVMSALKIDKIYKNATIAVLPSDHLIREEEMFIKTLKVAEDFIEKEFEAIVTLGMIPDRVETGYGYINFGENKTTIAGFDIKAVYKFVEKPAYEEAKKYILEGNYLWNGGMFLWKAETIFSLSQRFMPSTFKLLREIVDSDDQNLLKEKYPLADDISVDYAIMERAENIYVIPCEFGWDDIGTWEAVERYREKDENLNICSGEVTTIQSNNNLLISNNKPIVIVGMDDVFCVETDEVILIGKKQYLANIKEVRNKIN